MRDGDSTLRLTGGADQRPNDVLEHWGLSASPFQNVPNPDTIYLSDSHRWALDLLTYAVNECKAGALLTGAYGTGKTTIVRVLLGQLDLERFATVFINYPLVDSETLFRQILEQLGTTPRLGANKAELYNQLAGAFLDNVSDDRHNLLVLDEAQALPLDSIYEELRLLLNYQLNDRNLVTLVLVGQDDLWARVSKLPQLVDRIPVKCRIAEFDLEQTRSYITHRLQEHGATVPVFTDEAIRMIHDGADGIPRRINNLCDLALLMGWQRELDTIGPDIIRAIWV